MFSRLCHLYESDAIFDKFGVCWSGDDQNILTGGYNNYFRTFRRPNRSDTTFEANISLYNRRATADSSVIGRRTKSDINVDSMDFDKKIMHVVTLQ
jgi:serine/threonine-protein phosphatase 2A regulatory subunit B